MKKHVPSPPAKISGKKLRFRVSALLLAALLLFAALDLRLAVRRYVIDADEISSPVRIALVTDLHSCRYGDGQRTLIDAVNALQPDLLLLGGDIFDDVIPDTNTELFLAGIAERYPCYYVTGNHEHWSGPGQFAAKMDILRRYGVTILSGAYETVSVCGQTINICGIDDPDAFPDAAGRHIAFTSQLNRVAAAADNGCYTVLLSHRPEYFESYVSCGFDLALCGHAHGGQWRLPPILNGLFAPDQGILPQYAGGQYEKDGTTMIVSRGLARESTRIPRIFNRPELVLIELQ